jgi:hypothetical protein
VKLSVDGGELVENTIMYKLTVKNLIYITNPRPNLNYTINWIGEPIHANIAKVTFGCSEAHIEIH